MARWPTGRMMNHSGSGPNYTNQPPAELLLMQMRQRHLWRQPDTELRPTLTTETEAEREAPEGDIDRRRANPDDKEVTPFCGRAKPAVRLEVHLVFDDAGSEHHERCGLLSLPNVYEP